jgi:hypothetical protein
MPHRFICPHCHSSIDPLTLEVANSAKAQYRICTECDGLIVAFARTEDTDSEPSVVVQSTDSVVENCTL